MAPSKGLSGEAQSAFNQLNESRTAHDEWVRKVDRRYKSYRGILDPKSQAAEWTHKLTPPYINHIVETTVANLADDEIKFAVKPRPKLYNPGELQNLRQGAKALELLLGWQMDADRVSEKQRALVLQNAIAGMSVAKVMWRSSTRLRKKLVREPQVGADGQINLFPQLVETNEPEVVYDGPTVEPVDVRDFLFDQASTSLDTCPIVAHRVWKTFDELKLEEKAGRYSNVDELKEKKGPGDQYSTREMDVSNVDRTKGRIEVLEIYKRTQTGIKIFVIGAGEVQLADAKALPYWHGQMPFVVCTTQPDLFRIPGMSQVEKIEALQEMLWSVANQRLDNLELINNAIVLLRDDLDDPDAFEYAPRARNFVSDPAQVQMWTPNPVPAEVSIPAEGILKQDMQNLAGGFPFTSTGEARGVDANTATEASLVTNLAQASLKAQRTQLNYAYARIGQQMLELNQQYVRDPVMIQVVGVDSAEEIQAIMPEILQGTFDFDITPMQESLMRQERRAEAQGLYKVALEGAPIHAAIAQGGAGKPLNLDAFMEDVLDAFDKKDNDRYFASAAPALPQQGQQPQQGPPGQGVTSPLASGPQSPSNANTMNPAAQMQQMLALKGGSNNVAR
jgi:hypothetical protein